jgi:tetratricopeptide (TPR) repeat protein
MINQVQGNSKHLFLALILMLLPVLIQSQNRGEKQYYYEKKAEFKGGAFDKYLYTQLTYPLEDLKRKRQGIVLVSFKIKSDGSLDSIIPLEFKSKAAAADLITAIQNTSGFWRPTIIQGNPEAYTYLVACYYRINNKPKVETEFLKAKKDFSEKKYEKTIKKCKKALKDFPYDPDIYLLMVRAYKALDDGENVDIYFKKYNDLNKVFMANLYITALGITRTERVVSRRVRKF